MVTVHGCRINIRIYAKSKKGIGGKLIEHPDYIPSCGNNRTSQYVVENWEMGEDHDHSSLVKIEVLYQTGPSELVYVGGRLK